LNLTRHQPEWVFFYPKGSRIYLTNKHILNQEEAIKIAQEYRNKRN
jgi:hypothetical protein